MAAAYIERLMRLERGLTKIKKDNRCPADYGDDLRHFFIDCHHLKDHIINDNSIPQPIRNYVEKFVNNDQYLRLSADLANRDKHLELRNIKVDAKLSAEIDVQRTHTIHVRGEPWLQFSEVINGVAPPQGNPQKNTIEIEGNRPVNNVKNEGSGIRQSYYIEDNKGNSYNAILVAAKCYQTWVKFLKLNGLPVSFP